MTNHTEADTDAPEATSDGVDVTAEATPHHLLLTDELARTYDPLYKVNPPLRCADDVNAVREGLIDGTIDAVATDHAPHTAQRKAQPWREDSGIGESSGKTFLAVSH